MKTSLLRSSSARRAKHIVVLLTLAGLISIAPAVIAADATLAEMLELGIYSEESKGDLPAAMKLYEQIVAEAGAGQVVAAQAQFRLAMCHHKQGDYAAATTAFEKLVRDFPAQTELVTLANEYLADGAALLPVPWPDQEQLHFDVRVGSGFKVGGRLFATEAASQNDHKIWRFNSTMIAGAVAWSQVEVDAASFRPLHCWWRMLPIGEADTTYDATGANVVVKGKEGSTHVDLAGAFYDNEQGVPLMRRLPFAPGYKTQLKIFVGLGGTVLPLELNVVGVESVQVPAGTFDCFKVATNIGQTFWYANNAARLPVKFEGGGATFELSAITHHAPTESVRYEDPTFAFSFATPASFLVTRKEPASDPERGTALVIDAGGKAITQVKIEPLAHFDAATQASVRAFAEHQLAQGAKYIKDLKAREDSWLQTTVAGQPAWSVVFDGVQQDAPKVGRAVYAIVAGNAVDISTMTAPEDFAAFQPEFEAIVASYRGN